MFFYYFKNIPSGSKPKGRTFSSRSMAEEEDDIDKERTTKMFKNNKRTKTSSKSSSRGSKHCKNDHGK